MKYRSRRTRKELEAERYLRFSIRKFNVGTASVAVAAGLMFMGGPGVRAEEVPSNTNPEQSQTTEGSPTETAPASQATETAPATPSVDKSALTSLLAEVAALDVSGKTEASRTALATAVEAAKLVEADSAATQEAVDAAVTEVKAALLQLEDQPAASRLVPISYKVQYVDAVTGDVISNEHRLATIETTEAIAVTDVTVTAKTLKNHVLAEGQATTITQTLRSDQKNLITFKVVAKTATVAESAPATSTETPAAPVAPTVETPTVTAPVVAETPVQDQAAATEESKLVAAEATAAPSAVTASNTETASLSDPVLLAAASQVEDRGFTGFRAQTTGTSNTTPAAAGSGVTTGLKVQFFDASGQEITADSIVNGRDGQNIAVTLKVTFPEGSTNRTVRLKLGNLLSFTDDRTTAGVVEGAGMADETVNKLATLTGPTATTTELLGENGAPYRNYRGNIISYPSNYEAVYEVNSNGLELSIPLNLKVDSNFFIQGLAKSGAINSSANGIERTTPLTVTVSAQSDTGQSLTATSAVNNISLPDKDNSRRFSYFATNYSILPAYQNANNQNGYLVDMHSGVTIEPATTYYETGTTFTYTLPKGVSYDSLPTYYLDNSNFEFVSSVKNEETGVSTLTIRVARPVYATGVNVFVRLKVDTSQMTASSFRVPFTVGDTLKIRNVKDTITLYNAPKTAPQSSGSYSMNVAEYGEENIGLGRADIPGAVDFDATSYTFNVSGEDDGVYSALALTGWRFITNFDNEATGNKEFHYVIPDNPAYEVKGIGIPLINNNYTVTTIKVKTAANNQWQTTTLPKGLKYVNNNTGLFVTLADMGLPEDTKLTEVVIPIGQIPALYNGTAFPSYGDSRWTVLFGNILTHSNTRHDVMTLTLRDENYDASVADRDILNGTQTLQNTFVGNKGINDLQILVDSSKELTYTKSGTLTYTIQEGDGQDTRYLYYSTKVSEAYVVLPSQVNVKNIRVRTNNTFITPDVVQTKTQSNGNTIYKLDFSKVTAANNYVGWVKTADKTAIQKIYVLVDVENDVQSEIIVPYNQTFFAVAANDRTTIGPKSVNGQDPYNLVAKDTLLFTNQPTTNNLKLSRADAIDVRSAAKLSTETSFSSATSNYKLTSINENLNLEYTFINPNNNDITSIDMFIPVPKKGQNFGTNFQSEAFSYGLTLTGMPVLSSGFTDIYEVIYATVDASKLTGDINQNTERLSTETFTATPTDFSTVNLIRVKTKANTPIPVGHSVKMNLTYQLDRENIVDGSTLSWAPYFAAQFKDYRTAESSRTINLQVALGKLGVQVFNDTNMSGTQQSAETSLIADVNYTVFNSEGETVATGKTVNGTAYVSELVSGQTYTVRFANPDKTTKRFTTGTVAADKSYTNVSITDELKPEAQVTVTKVGLTSAKTTHGFTTGTSGTLAAATAAGFYDDKIAAPAVTAKAGFTFAGWRESTGTAVLSAADLAKQDFGKTAKTYVAEYVKSTATVSLDLGATAHPDVTVKLKKGTTVVETVLIPNGTQTKTWTNLDMADYTIEVVDVTGYTETLAGGTKVTTALPTNLAQYATRQAGDVQNANVQTQAFTLSLTKVADSYNPVGLTNKILVNDTNNLSSDEQTQVANAVKAANTSLPADATYVSDNKGRVTITYSDGSQDFVEAAQTVLQKGTLTAHKVNKVDSDDTSLSGTGHAGATVSVTLPNGQVKSATVGTNGQWTINLGTTVPTGTILSVTQTMTNFKDSTPVPVTVAATTAETSNPVLPASKMAVDTYGALTPTEVAALKALVEAANPGKTVTVDATGQATVTYPDGSKDIIAASELTVQRATSAKPSINRVDTDDLVVAGTGVNGSTVTVKIGNQAAVTRPVTNGVWSVTLTTPLAAGTAISVTQKETDKLVSPAETSTVQRTTADNTTPTVPITKVKVDDTNSLTPTEQAAVKAAVEAANPGTTATVDTKGNATVTYADGSKDTIPAASLVEQKATTAAPTVNAIDSDDRTISGTGVNGATITVVTPQGTQTVTVANGTWSVPLASPLTTGAQVTVTQQETGKLPSTVTKQVQATLAETATPVKPTTKVKVDNPTSLSPTEVAAVKAAVEAVNPKANPGLQSVAVDTKGNATLTYTDGSTKVIPAADLVEEKGTLTAHKVNKIDSDDTSLSGTGHAGATVSVTLPNGQVKSATVGTNGQWTINLGTTVPTGTILSVTQTRTNFKDSTPVPVTVAATTAETSNPVLPASKMAVDTYGALTPTEVAALKALVEAANPGKTVTVDATGQATVTYPDGSKDIIAASELTVQRATSAKPSINRVDTDDLVVAGTGVTGSTVTVKIGNQAAVTRPVTNGVWSVTLTTPLAAGTAISVTQKETDKLVSPAETSTVQRTTADNTTPTVPITKVKVDDTNSLTPTEQAAVKAAVEAANPGTTATVDTKGNATVTYADGSKDTIPAASLVEQKATTAAPVVNPLDSDDTTVSGTGTPGATITVVTPQGTQTVTVANGTWSVPLASPLTTGAQVTVTQQETGKLPSTVTKQVQATLAETATPVKPTTKVKVDNPTSLSPTEVAAVKAAVEAVNPKANPGLQSVAVDTKGNATLTYTDGSTKVIPAADLVEEKGTLTAHKVNKIDSDDTSLSGTGHAGATVSVTLPNGQVKSATVGTNGQWTINLGTTVPTGTILSVTQTRTNFKDSTPVPVTVAATTAETSNPVLPASKMAVDTYGALTPTEVAALKALVEAANPGKTVTVDATGQATVTYPDGSKDIIAASELTVQRATSAKPSINRVDTDDLVVAGTGVTGSTVTVKIGNQAAVTRPVTNGVWSVTLTTPLAAGTAISVTQKETDKLVSPAETSTVQRTTADNTTPTVPITKVKVDDTNSLTPTEQAAVKAAVEAANPGTTATVDTKGNATVTYADGSKDTIPAASLVEQKATTATPVVNPLDSDDTTVSGTGTPGATITVTYPDGSLVSSRVKPDGSWSVTVTTDLAKGESVTVTHFEDGKLPLTLTIPVNPTIAEGNPLTKPSTVVPVTDPAKLTEAEIAAVKEVVQAANPSLDLDQIAVSPTGDVTVTYADGTTNSLPASDVVRPKTAAEKFDVATPASKVAVTNPSNLTEAEKEAVRDLIRATNPDLPADATITVEADGTTTVSYPDGTAETPIPGSSLVYAAADTLAQAKEEAKKAVNALPYLTDEQKKDFIDQIEAATDKPSIDTLVAEARKLNDAQAPADLDAVKKQAIAEINALPYLTDEDKAALLAKVEAAQDIPTVQKVQEEARALNDQRAAELAQAKEEAKAVIEALPLLTAEEKAAFKEAVDKATTIPAIEAIVAEARALNDDRLVDPTTPLDKAKEAAIAEINALPYLTDAEKAAYVDAVNAAQTVPAVQAELAEARALNDARAAELARAKADAKAVIDSLPLLTDAEKAVAKDAIDKAADKPAIDAIVDAARALNDSRMDDLAKAKEAAIAEINGLPYLTDAEKAAYVDAVNAAQDIPAVQAELAEARALNDARAAELARAKADAKAVIDSLPNLTAEEKAAFKDGVDKAADKPAIDAIVDAARALNDSRNDSLEEAKANAIAEIKALPHLTDAEKQAAIDAVNAATTIPAVQAELADARALNDARAAELAQAKTAAKAVIDSLPYLTEAEKAAYADAVNAAQDIPAVQAELADARALNDARAAELAQAKTAAKAVIDSLPNLTAEEKAAAKDAIDKAADKPAIDAIVAEARALNDSRNDSLDKAKEAAIAEINTLPNLTEAEKQAAIDAVNAATTPEAVQTELDKARELNDQRAADLLKAKTAAKEAIDALPNLTAEEKAAFKAAVDAATTIPAVQAVVDEARALNDSRNAGQSLDATKQAAKTEIAQLPLLTDSEKADFVARIDAATTPEAVQAILDEARKLNDSRQTGGTSNGGGTNTELPTIDVKALAKEEVNALAYLTADEKAAFAARIDAAADVDAVAAIVDEARSLNAAKQLAQLTLDAAKAAAKEVIQGLGNLSAADKAALLDRLAAAADLAAVSALVEEARRLDAQAAAAQAAAAQAAAQALADAKKTAIDAINQLPHLSAAEKQAHINAIQSAQNVDAVLAVLETARANAATAQVKAAKVQASSSLPATGQADSSAILSLAIAMILASLAVLGLPRKEDNR